ncbi:MAG TPA: chemotaxis protein CheA [Vicinamibacteria bacterium]|nr:chemotaxis protein CheA [Vicinamibacteria bacterium]
MADFQISPELLTIYLEDARQHLEALDHCLLSLEREGLDLEVVAGVMGPLHTLKGNSGMIGFGAIKNYVHRLEDAFARISEGALALSPQAFDRLFAGATALRDAVEQAAQAKREVRDLVPETRDLDGLLRAAHEGPTASYLAAVAPPDPPSVPAGAPEVPASAPGRAMAATAPAAPVASPAPAAPAPAQRAPSLRADQQYVSVRSNMVRVEFSQLDHLLNLVGELIIYRTKLQDLARRLGEKADTREEARELLAAVQQVAGASGQLQETVMDVRMLPIRHVFDRFPRMVRDLARQTGKEIELILEGEGTRIDKAIIDEIGEPLVHLIRNSVDHGIEPPDVREAQGKNRTGTILLSATQESNHVLITIMDDGAGIDAAAVRRVAMARGLLRGDEALSEREVIQLIFAQGFSTRAAVTEVSGRGVGLDVVLKSIERLNGLIEVETVPGVGTKFIIQLPLTLAIIAALLVEVSGRTYAIPLGAVVESIRFSPEDVHFINGRPTLRIRDRIVPLTRLSEVFGVPGPPAGRHEYAVIIGRGDKRVGLVVDRLRGQQEVVIKALDPAVQAAVGMAGATIMGDGRVVLILDVGSLLDVKRHHILHQGRLHELEA